VLKEYFAFDYDFIKLEPENLKKSLEEKYKKDFASFGEYQKRSY
jgi:hypothetical protein